MGSPLEQGQALGEHWWLGGDVFGDAEGLTCPHLCRSLTQLLLDLLFSLGTEPGAGQGSGSPSWWPQGCSLGAHHTGCTACSPKLWAGGPKAAAAAAGWGWEVGDEAFFHPSWVRPCVVALSPQWEQGGVCCAPGGSLSPTCGSRPLTPFLGHDRNCAGDHLCRLGHPSAPTSRSWEPGHKPW